MKYRLFDRACCKKCGQDIENNGKKQWTDRGGNRLCVAEIRKGEIVQPKKNQKHAPY